MKLKDAIKRIGFTISKSNKPNQTDAEAYNALMQHLQKSESEVIQNNLLFAKLYALVLEIFVTNYNDVDFSNKQLNKILAEPMDLRIEFLLLKLKHSELIKVVKDDCIVNSEPEIAILKLKEFPIVAKEFIHLWDYWEKDNVISHLNTNINLSIQNFKNHV
jgi:hypothetical protein